MPPTEEKSQANPTRASTFTSLPLFLTCQPGSLKDAAGHPEPPLRAAGCSPTGSAQPPRGAHGALAANPRSPPSDSASSIQAESAATLQVLRMYTALVSPE